MLTDADSHRWTVRSSRKYLTNRTARIYWADGSRHCPRARSPTYREATHQCCRERRAEICCAEQHQSIRRISSGMWPDKPCGLRSSTSLGRLGIADLHERGLAQLSAQARALCSFCPRLALEITLRCLGIAGGHSVPLAAPPERGLGCLGVCARVGTVARGDNGTDHAPEAKHLVPSCRSPNVRHLMPGANLAIFTCV